MTPHRLPPLTLLAVLLLLAASACTTQAQQSEPGGALDLGTLDFPTSATGEAQEAFLTGVLALHSFWYPEARDHFRRARDLDPAFAMAYWGEAMTHDHPLWNQHDDAAGQAALARLDSVQQMQELEWSDRERRFVAAVRTLFEGEGNIAARRTAYADTMQHLADAHPGDDEAALFSVLAQMSTPGFEFENPEDVVSVAATLEDIYQDRPEHPGVLHYLIHTYDSDTFAPLGLRPARTYAEVAPASAHALHMPSHIFRQLDQWERVAASNEDAYRASVDWQERTDRPLHMRDYHSFSWLMDAYLELDRFDDACTLIEELDEIDAAARERGEDLGRIPSLTGRFEERYRATAEEAGTSTSCEALQ